MLTHCRFSSIPTSSRCSGINLPGPICRKLCLLLLLERTVPSLCAVRVPRLAFRCCSHSTANLILHLSTRRRYCFFRQHYCGNEWLRRLIPNANISPAPLSRRSSHARCPRFSRGIHLNPVDRLTSSPPHQRELLCSLVHLRLIACPVALQTPPPLFHISLRSSQRSPPMVHVALPRHMRIRHAVPADDRLGCWWEGPWS